MNELSIEKEIMRETIQALTFTNSIDVVHLAESIEERESPKLVEEKIRRKQKENLKEEPGHLLAQSTRIRRLLNTLVLRENNEDTTSKKNLTFDELVLTPKIYDHDMFDNQINLYNRMSDVVGMPPIDTTVMVSLEGVKSALLIDEDPLEMDYELLAKHFPYLNPFNRTGFHFLEYIFLLNLVVNTHGKTLGTLNAPITDKKRRFRAKTWIKRLLDEWDFETIYNPCVDTFLMIYYQKLAQKHAPAADVVAKMILPEKYQERKDPYRAVSSAMRKKVLPSEIFTFEMYDKLKNKPFETSMWESYRNTYDYIESDVIPVARGILVGDYSTFDSELPSRELSFDSISDDDKLAIVDTMEFIYETSRNADECNYVYTPKQLTISDMNYEHNNYIDLYIKAHNLAYNIHVYITNALKLSKEVLRVFSEYETYKKD